MSKRRAVLEKEGWNTKPPIEAPLPRKAVGMESPSAFFFFIVPGSLRHFREKPKQGRASKFALAFGRAVINFPRLSNLLG